MTAARAALLCTLVLAGCATSPQRTAQTAQCRDYFDALDAQVAHAGVRDAGADRIDGFPYLRIDRFTSALRDQLSDEPRKQLWFELLRQRDEDARRAELANLGVTDLDREMQHVASCGHSLVAFELASPQARAQLIRRASVDDDYYLPARIFGLYPLAVPLLNLGIRSYHRETERDFAKPIAELDHPGTLVRWEPADDAPSPKDVKAWLARVDAFGIPKLDAAQWQRLARAHAPTWWIEEAAAFDRPGAPALRDRPTVDWSQPVVYFQAAYTRFAGKVLAQLVYTIWFSQRPKQKFMDGYAGALDGVVWRVTLDADGSPLLYDTIHPCGCYRMYFPVWPAARKPQGGWFEERALFPQADVPKHEPVAIRVQSATHFVRRVLPEAEARADQVRQYELRPYAELLSVDAGNGKRRSLFDEDGIVAGTERGERWWLWMTGVDEPGAMRQWGRHATSFVGRGHFDDPDFLDQLFALPMTGSLTLQ
ncbi:MAG TPA: hypothetical protein VFB36_08730 [Nevskiaceae bacterium]|nr:hypothetical protein [Nevskiaceae bacterium]